VFAALTGSAPVTDLLTALGHPSVHLAGDFGSAASDGEKHQLTHLNREL
jgi:hypothetical protein